MIKNFTVLLLLLFVLTFSSCVVSFKNPISDSQTPDSRLLGRWKAADKGEEIFEFSVNENSKMILKFAKETGAKEDNSDEKVVFIASAVQISDQNFLSLQIDSEDREKTFLIAKYKFESDGLNVWLLEKNKVNKLIELGKINGDQKSNGEISVSASPTEIRELLRSPESEGLFEHLAKLKKQ